MNVRLDKTCPLPCTPEVAWAFLQDIESLAGCMPGARITERLDDRYKGTITVKVGPATLAFRGDLTVQDIDPAARSLRLVGKGTDSTGGSGASMNLVARIDPAEGGTSTLAGTSEVSMSGKAAAFGARMVNSVADQILRQFAENVAARVAALPPPAPPSGTDRAAGENAAAHGAPLVDVPPPAPPARELDGLALAWNALKSWIRGLFAKKTA